MKIEDLWFAYGGSILCYRHRKTAKIRLTDTQTGLAGIRKRQKFEINSNLCK
ncbi:hypothetical protein D1AOALGA4SA_3449 [Olavius algarvensis Delta 1 endosymbiont]|nr:hypothetical protein D1AOALGA4SA_3449 [Olavius algarvensis Delta 1 endosymbiont]